MPDAMRNETIDKKTAKRRKQPGGESRSSVVAAILGNILVGFVKFVAAAISGSTAMFSEGIHSIVDSGNGLLILLGLKRSRQKPDITHPFGYGKELYFWTFVVSLLIFALGGVVSIFEGIRAILSADASKLFTDPMMSYVVLLLAAIIEGASLSVALKTFNAARGKTAPLEFIREAKDPSLYTVVLEDSAAELGLVFAFCGLFFGRLLKNPYLDGVASIFIGALLCTVAVVLLKETKGLLIGEGLSREEIGEVRAIVEDDPVTERCGRVLTMYMGPYNLLVTIDVGFKIGIAAEQVLESIDRIEAKVQKRFPETYCVFVETEGLKQVQDQSTVFEKACEEPD